MLKPSAKAATNKPKVVNTSVQKAQGDSKLPSIGVNKFSSWATAPDSKNPLQDFDELLKENDYLLHNSSSAKDNSYEIDFDEVIDELGGTDLHDNNPSKMATSKTIESFDLENSDELNKLITRCEETMEKKPITKVGSDGLEDSWNSLQQQAEQMLSGGRNEARQESASKHTDDEIDEEIGKMTLEKATGADHHDSYSDDDDSGGFDHER